MVSHLNGGRAEVQSLYGLTISNWNDETKGEKSDEEGSALSLQQTKQRMASSRFPMDCNINPDCRNRQKAERDGNRERQLSRDFGRWNGIDSSYKRGQPAEFQVNGVIKGWVEALQMMPVGSKWELYIPPSLHTAIVVPAVSSVRTRL